MGLFHDPSTIAIILPTGSSSCGPDREQLGGLRDLIERERNEFVVEFGAPISITDSPPESGPRVLIGPAHVNPWFETWGFGESDSASVRFDNEEQILTIDGADLAQVIEGLSLLRTMTSTGATAVTAEDCRDVAGSVERVRREVAATYPSFSLRGIDWDRVSEKHIRHVTQAADTFAALQRWIAELQDMHTWIRPEPADGLLPYLLHVTTEEAVFWRVPEWSAAYQAGVRPGDRLVEVDTRDFWERHGGPDHMRPFLVGRRLLSGPSASPRRFTVRNRQGRTITFDDTPSFQPWSEPVSWTRLESGTGYLRLLGFPPGTGNAVDTGFQELRGCDRLIVDLRGNAGGLLVEALNLRDRFLDRPATMGSIQYSAPEGGLSQSFLIEAEPAPEQSRWDGLVRFLTDPLTASASEDALLGLRGLAHVKTVGTRTAGGSGRPRTVRLLPGMRLSVSTALTFERNGNCIEGNGIPADIPVPFQLPDPDRKTLLIADRSW